MNTKSLYEHIPHPHRIHNANRVHKSEIEARNFNERLAVAITKGFGSIWALYVLIAWMLLWMALASGGIWLFAQDKYPFSFLLFLSNLVQLWALPVLAFGQAVLSRKAELQADEQYKDVENTYHDIEQIMIHLDAQDKKIIEIAEMFANQGKVLQTLTTELQDIKTRLSRMRGYL